MQNDTKFTPDEVVGIAIMVFSASGIILGTLLALGMGFLGAAAAGAGAASGRAAAAFGFMGHTGAIVGTVFILFSVVSIVTGYGIMKGAKWGFLLGCVGYGLSLLGSLSSPGIGLLISVGLSVYCLLRLAGKFGPRPA